MIIFGVMGGIGSGKSSFSSIMEKNGALVLDADKINHQNMLRGSNAYKEILKQFSTEILNEQLEIDRKKLSEIVFNNKEKLNKLIEITHKFVIQHIKLKIEQLKLEEFKSTNNVKIIVIDAPLLIEAKLNELCDKVVLITSEESIKIKRVIERSNLTKDEIKGRMKNQKTDEMLSVFADYIIENNYSLLELEREVEKIIDNEIRKKQ